MTLSIIVQWRGFSSRPRKIRIPESRAVHYIHHVYISNLTSRVTTTACSPFYRPRPQTTHTFAHRPFPIRYPKTHSVRKNIEAARQHVQRYDIHVMSNPIHVVYFVMPSAYHGQRIISHHSKYRIANLYF